MRSDDNKLVDIEDLRLKHTTYPESSSKGAYLIDTGDEEIWLPKSQVEIERQGDGLVTVTLPEWLAIEKGLA